MGKYLSNGLAYLRGVLINLFSVLNKKVSVGTKSRVFCSAVLKIHKGGYFRVGKDAKIREKAFISVRKNAEFVLAEKATVGMDCKIVCHNSIKIGEGTLLSPNVLIYDHDHVFTREEGVKRREFVTDPVEIGKNCWIGANTVILKGTRIGNNCVVGAGSVVHGTFPSGVLIVQKRNTEILSVYN